MFPLEADLIYRNDPCSYPYEDDHKGHSFLWLVEVGLEQAQVFADFA